MAPAISVGAMTQTTRRKTPDQSGTFVPRAFSALALVAMATDTAAAGIQILSSVTFSADQLSQAATSPTMPLATSPQPETAVKVEAVSMVRRM
jgi:hypothetical protein